MSGYYGTGAGQLTADSSLQGVTKSFGGGEAYNYNSGNLLKNKGSGMDPLSAGLGAGASIFSNIMQGQAMNRQSDAMFAAAKAHAQAAERAGFQNLLAGQYALTGAKQFEQGLQREAANYQQAFLDPRKSILNAENITRAYGVELNPFAEKLRQKEQASGINTLLAGKYNPYFGGEVALSPFSFGRSPGYTTGSLV